MKKPFFFRIDSADLLNFATDPEGDGMTLLQFAKELQRGKSDIKFIQSIIDEASEYSKKKSDAAHKRWNAQHMQTNAQHMHSNASSSNIKNKPIGVKRFTPPTLEQVRDYCAERDNGVNAENFIDHYTAKGWMIGKNKMKDWKAAVRTWESTSPKKPKKMTDLIVNYGA